MWYKHHHWYHWQSTSAQTCNLVSKKWYHVIEDLRSMKVMVEKKFYTSKIIQTNKQTKKLLLGLLLSSLEWVWLNSHTAVWLEIRRSQTHHHSDFLFQKEVYHCAEYKHSFQAISQRYINLISLHAQFCISLIACYCWQLCCSRYYSRELQCSCFLKDLDVFAAIFTANSERRRPITWPRKKGLSGLQKVVRFTFKSKFQQKKSPLVSVCFVRSWALLH